MPSAGIAGRARPREPWSEKRRTLPGVAASALLVRFLFLTTLAWLGPGVGTPDPAEVVAAHAATAEIGASWLSALSLLAVNLTGVPTALTLLPWTWVMRERRPARPALLAFGTFVAVLHLVSTCAFARPGFLAPSGISVYLTPPLSYAWVIWVATLRIGAT